LKTFAFLWLSSPPNLTSGEPVVFTQGNLVDAIRASCAFPGLFEPVEIGTRCLADGGLVAPVPTRAARELGATTVIGISVGMQDGYRGAPTNIFQVVSRAVSAAQKHQLEVWERHADLVLRPDVAVPGLGRFDRAEEAIESRRCHCAPALPRIQKLLDRRTPRRSSAKPVSRPKIKAICGLRRPFDDTLSACLAVFTMLLLLWHECGEDVGVFCYRIGAGAFANVRSRSLVPVPIREAVNLSVARTTPSARLHPSLLQSLYSSEDSRS